MTVSLFQCKSGIYNSKNRRYNKVTTTTLTQQRFAFVSFKTMAARFREISGEEIQKLAGKNSKTKVQSKLETWMNVWKSWVESKGLNDDVVEYEGKEHDKCLSRFFAEIRKSDGSD